MKYIFLAIVTMGGANVALAHDGSDHIATAWYQDLSPLSVLLAFVAVAALLGAISYALPQYRKVWIGLSALSLLLGVVSYQTNYSAPLPVDEQVAASLQGVPVTVYRTEGCTCCGGYAKELAATGAEVTVETISGEHMRSLKTEHGIAPQQASCHTSEIAGYVVEGHVPFAAVAQLVDERPDISGISLPGMPIGTPGMPGLQTNTYTVSTLADDIFWQSS